MTVTASQGPGASAAAATALGTSQQLAAETAAAISGFACGSPRS